MLDETLTFLKGKKTYLLAFAAAIYGLTGYLTGNITFSQAAGIIWSALSVAGLRAGIFNTVDALLSKMTGTPVDVQGLTQTEINNAIALYNLAKSLKTEVPTDTPPAQ